MQHGTFVYSLTRGTVIEVSVATRDGWDKVEIDWATLLARRFDGSLPRTVHAELVGKTNALIGEMQNRLFALYAEYMALVPKPEPVCAVCGDLISSDAHQTRPCNPSL